MAGKRKYSEAQLRAIRAKAAEAKKSRMSYVQVRCNVKAWLEFEVVDGVLEVVGLERVMAPLVEITNAIEPMQWEELVHKHGASNYRQPLTTPEAIVLGAISELTNRDGKPPTIRRIGEHLGLSSTGWVHKLVTDLEDKERLDRVGKRRAIVLRKPVRIPSTKLDEDE